MAVLSRSSSEPSDRCPSRVPAKVRRPNRAGVMPRRLPTRSREDNLGCGKRDEAGRLLLEHVLGKDSGRFHKSVPSAALVAGHAVTGVRVASDAGASGAVRAIPVRPGVPELHPGMAFAAHRVAPGRSAVPAPAMSLRNPGRFKGVPTQLAENRDQIWATGCDAVVVHVAPFRGRVNASETSSAVARRRCPLRLP